MAWLKNFVISIVVLVVLFVLVGFALPSTFKVERTVMIDAPANQIFPYVKDLKQWKRWGVWFKRDPDMQVEYSGPEQGVGMTSRWQSDSEGNGEMEVMAITPDEKLVYSLRFPEMEMASTGEVILSEAQGQTRVVWMDYGDVGANPLYHYFALFMDGMIGPDFEAGLHNLKMLVENEQEEA